MTDIVFLQIDLSELSRTVGAPAETIVEIVEQGIVEPKGSEPENWQFDSYMISMTRKALRLHQDLKIEWSGIALAMNLLDELEQLREQNKRLQQRLDRFLAD